MQSADLNQSYKDAESQISSIKDYNESSKAEKNILKSAGNSFSKSVSNASTQLNKISDKQKRFERNVPSSMDQLVKLFGVVNGQGPESLKFLRKKLLEASVKIGPDVEKIITEETIKALGCSQEQTYKGFPKSEINKLQSLQELPVEQGIYIPVSSIDIFGNLKNSPTSPVGKTYYEKEQPSVDPDFKPYGGDEPFPMNKELNLRMNSDNTSRSFKTEYGKNYQGVSQQDLFNFEYTKTNEFGVTGDYFRVVLIDREGENGNTGLTANKVGQFITDYYKTIKLVDSVDITGQIVNLVSGAVNIKAGLGPSQLSNQSKFAIIAARILGLCFDSRREIDVSGVSKIGELDGVDDAFFEFTEIDLRNIDTRTNNVQNGVMEFEDCDNVKLPVDVDTLINSLINFRDSEVTQTQEQKVAQMESIIDTISQNPDWKLYVPANFNASAAINTNILKQIPIAVAASVLTPKVLLPIFTMLSVLQTSAKNTVNEAITTTNSSISSTNTLLNQTNNVINNEVDFLNKFRTFNIQVISKIGALYLKTLFDILKKDIINLLTIIIGDITKSSIQKKYAIILRFVQIALVLEGLIQDYRKCKSLIDEILQLLKLINGLPIKRLKIPSALLALSEFLPGKDPNRATNNTIEFLQKVGVPTGVLPDGSPNFMNFFNKAVHKGADKEEAENGVSDSEVWVPTIGRIPVFNKPR
jgi:hypothetical protein